MAKRKKAGRNFLAVFILVSLVAAGSFLIYLGYLWWESRRAADVRYTKFGIPIPDGYFIHGIDVSKYQQMISWTSVKEMNVSDIRLGFAFMKATEGVGNTDPFFRRNWKKSKEAGVVRGAYHFFIASKDGISQARNFISRVDLEPGDLPPVLDIEQNFRTTAVALRKEVKEWLDAVEANYHIRPIIYTNIDFYERYLKGSFDEYPLWVAHYLHPDGPRIARDWAFWQHSEQGRVNGILTPVDFNVFSGDSDQFRALLLP